MSRQLTDAYFNEIDRLKKFSGTTTEGVISEAFKDLLKAWSKGKNLQFVAQYSNQKTQIRPDGTILHDLRVPLGYWEAKDEDDDLDVEIEKKLRKGYPQDNIIFEDSREAVLIQNRQRVLRCKVTDGKEPFRLLTLFFGYERKEIADFRKAVQQFQHDMPAVLSALRDKISDAYKANGKFKKRAAVFLRHAQRTINPSVNDSDIREMLIQHILTEEIFSHVFNESDFHKKNNIASQLYALEDEFFTGSVKKDTLHGLEPYYATIRSTAALITSHTEKQQFLRVIYENFYKIHDKKKADRLGVVYTPSDIVRFIVDGADHLTQKHYYAAVNDYAKLDEKQAFIAGKTLGDIAFETIKPDSQHNWVGLTENDWHAFPPIASKATKGAKTTAQIRAIFKDYALGISTNRDDWLYGFDKGDVEEKAKALIKAYSAVPSGSRTYPDTVKWSETLKRHLKAGRREKFNPAALRKANYRPFVPRWLYQSNLFIDRTGGLDSFFPLGRDNKAICFSDIGSRTGTCILAIDQPADLHFGAAIDGYQQVSLYRFASNGERVDNVTDWALRLYEKAYGTTGLLSPSRGDGTDTKSDEDAKPKKGGRPAGGSRKLTKASIFDYVYAVLYDPSYRERYALNLRREFPRIPFYEDFWTWSDWGRDLMALHMGFENVTPWPIKRTDKPLKEGASRQSPKVLLKASKDKRSVLVDSVTSLLDIPPESWTYQLGNRSALAWVLEQHKETKPKDPVIAASFNNYRLADIKEDFVVLIGKICQVSVETVRITDLMRAKNNARDEVRP